MITQSELKEVLDYNPETGIFIWRVRSNNNLQIGDVAGCTFDEYCYIGINNKVYATHRLAWLYVYGYFPENNIDHKDRNPSNNRIDNLREVGQQCNTRNTGNRIDNTSGIKGIAWFKRDQNWRVYITIDGKQYHLGYHKDFYEAVCARLAVEQCLDWHGCDSNSPAYAYVQKYIMKELK
jgi:hypothetical protein